MTYQSLATNPYELLEKVVPDESDYKVAFSGKVESYCIGMVDIVNSTRISAGLREDGWCKYYIIFLNSMAKILNRFGGVPIKNNGDSLLYYFPQSADRKTKYGFVSCLECSLAMIEARELLSYTSQKNGLPSLNYRISTDYGKVTIMEPNNLSPMDVMGPPVNMCSKNES